MKITLNNRPEEFQDDSMSIRDILMRMNFTFPRIIVKLNGKLIKKPFYDNTIVENGDILEVVHLISGG